MGLIKPKKQTKISFRKIGIVMMILGLAGVIFSIYLLAAGTKAQAQFKELKATKNKYINVYVYSVDDKEYEYTERTDREDAAKPGDTKTVRYLSFSPSVTYDSKALVLGSIVFAIGAVGFVLQKKKSRDE